MKRLYNYFYDQYKLKYCVQMHVLILLTLLYCLCLSFIDNKHFLRKIILFGNSIVHDTALKRKALRLHLFVAIQCILLQVRNKTNTVI